MSFIGRPPDNKSPAVKSFFDSRSNSFFEFEITSLGVLPSINMIYSRWEKIVRDKISDLEKRAWDSFCESHPNMSVVRSCLLFVSGD